MKKNALWGLAGIAAIALVIAAGWLGRKVPFSEQWPLYEALRTTASIVFAVVGAWIAIIFPERLKLSFRKDTTAANANNGGVGQLLSPVAHSTAILSIVLFVGVIAPLVKRIEILHPYSTQLRGISYGLLVLLTLWQLLTVILTLIPANRIKERADADDSFRSTVSGYKRLGSQNSSPPDTP